VASGRGAQIPKERARRVTFNEITKRGVEEAFKRPGDISMPRVNAQQARRFLDRIVGYKLSPLLWKKGRARPLGRAGAVGGRPPDRGARARDQGLQAREYWTIIAKLDRTARSSRRR